MGMLGMRRLRQEHRNKYIVEEAKEDWIFGWHCLTLKLVDLTNLIHLSLNLERLLDTRLKRLIPKPSTPRLECRYNSLMSGISTVGCGRLERFPLLW